MGLINITLLFSLLFFGEITSIDRYMIYTFIISGYSRLQIVTFLLVKCFIKTVIEAITSVCVYLIVASQINNIVSSVCNYNIGLFSHDVSILLIMFAVYAFIMLGVAVIKGLMYTSRPPIKLYISSKRAK